MAIVGNIIIDDYNHVCVNCVGGLGLKLQILKMTLVFLIAGGDTKKDGRRIVN